MKLIQPKAELLVQESGLEGVYKAIERAGRTCYRSEDKMTEDSAKPFVDRMIKSNHTAMLEQGTVYLFMPEDEYDKQLTLLSYAVKQCEGYSKMLFGEDGVYITTNFRVIQEHKLNWLLEHYICEPTKFHERRYTFRLTTSIGVTRELNRHRVHSIAEQSTRYCNYSKDKFGRELSFCKPSWVDEEELAKIGPYKRVIRSKNASPTEHWITALLNAEDGYMELLHQGWQPQQAREVLPLCTATEIVHTAFASDWKRLLELRLFEKTGKVHPNMKQLMEKLKEECIKHGIWEDIMNQPSKFE